VHAASIVVVRMVDGAKPQPQTFKLADFLVWARKQVALVQEVISCYEAGPTGFWLHRQFTALGLGGAQLRGLSDAPGRATLWGGQRPDRCVGVG
jgi:hypothetical protein